MSFVRINKVLGLAMVVALFGGAAVCVYRAGAGPDDQRKSPPAKESVVAALSDHSQTTATTKILDEPAKFDNPIQGMTVAELFRKLSAQHRANFQLDVLVIRNLEGDNNKPLFDKPYEVKIDIPVVENLTVREVLNQVIDHYSSPSNSGHKSLAIIVKGNQIILAKPFFPPAVPRFQTAPPGSDGEAAFVPVHEMAEMLYGPPVSLTVDHKALGEVIDHLRDVSGANIVVDARLKEKMAAPITFTVNNTRLLPVLRIISDMCEIGVAVVDNIFYVTSAENGAKLMRITERNLLGEGIPSGYLTDGKDLYEKPPGLKPANNGVVLPMLGRMGSVVPKPVEEKPSEKPMNPFGGKSGAPPKP
jgi:hypothetical protein